MCAMHHNLLKGTTGGEAPVPYGLFAAGAFSFFAAAYGTTVALNHIGEIAADHARARDTQCLQTEFAKSGKITTGPLTSCGINILKVDSIMKPLGEGRFALPYEKICATVQRHSFGLGGGLICFKPVRTQMRPSASPASRAGLCAPRTGHGGA